MPDLTINLPDDVHESLLQLARSVHLEPEELARQIIAVWVGHNSSSKENPFSSILLRDRPEAVLSLAESGPVFLRDTSQRDFVILSDDDYSK